MEKFKFYAPTKVYFGKDEEQRVGKILQEYHPKKVLIHYGGKSAIQSGLLNRVKRHLMKKILPIVCVEVLLPIHYFQR